MKNQDSSKSYSSNRYWQRFKNNRRALYSMFVLVFIFVISLFAELIANDQPLLVKYKNSYYFPVIKTYTEQTFGGDFPTPTNYHDPFIKENINQNGYMIFPAFSYSFNTIDYQLNKPTPSYIR